MYLNITAKSAALQRAITFHVLLPYHDGYESAPRPWPTLYLLPGYSGNGAELVFGLPLRQMAAQYGIAVVIPDGENLFYTDHPERASRMGEYAGDELVRLSRRLIPSLSRERSDTFIGGISSMGGYGAAVLGLHYRDTFSKLALLSPAAEPDLLLRPEMAQTEGAVPASLFDALFGGAESYENSRRVNPLRQVESYVREGLPFPEIWMCCGREDALVGEACRHFRSVLEGAGAPLSWEDGSGSHDLIYWDAHLESAFRFLASP